MKRIFVKSIMGSGLLLVGLTAYAQDRDRDRDRDRDEDRYHRSDRGDQYWRGRMFERVRDDLDHIQAVTSPFSGDQYRLNKVKQELNELQAKMAENRYDQAEIDDVIGAMQRVVSDNRLSGRDRDMLNDDLNRLRGFREHHDGYR
jgi:hypothetical protein